MSKAQINEKLIEEIFHHASLDSKLKTIAIISSMFNGGTFIIRMGPGRGTRDSIIHKGDNLFSWTHKF